MTNFQVCRCCLRESPAKTYGIFDGTTIDDGSVENLQTALLKCVPSLHLQPDDGLPDLICEQCMLSLRTALDFQRRCEASERELQQRYADTERAIEEALRLVNLIDDMDKEVIEDKDCANGLQRRASELGANELALLDDLLQLEEVDLESLLKNEGSKTPHNSQKFKKLRRRAVKDMRLLSDATKKDSKAPAPRITKQLKETSNESSPPTLESPLSNDSTTSETVKKRSSRYSAPKSLHPCPECEKKFTRNFQLKLHMISVHKTGDGLYECSECNKTFASRHSLTYHQRSVHTDERRFACAHCERRFVLRTQLSSHMRIHTGEAKPRIFECLECGKRWPTKSDLRTHMRSHITVQERPFKCDQCEKAFFTRGHLNSHQLVHSGEKPFSCLTCGKSYQCVGNLNNHMARQHDFERGAAARGRSGNAENSEI